MWGWGTEYKHTWVHTSIQPHFLTCNFRSHQLSRVYFRMLQMVLDWCAYTWQIVSELVCVCVWLCLNPLCVFLCVQVYGNMYLSLCGLAYSPALQKRDANTPFCCSQNHQSCCHFNLCATSCGIAIYFGGKNSTLAQIWKALVSVCHMHVTS